MTDVCNYVHTPLVCNYVYVLLSSLGNIVMRMKTTTKHCRVQRGHDVFLRANDSLCGNPVTSN